jgi:hypothetical protein
MTWYYSTRNGTLYRKHRRKSSTQNFPLKQVPDAALHSRGRGAPELAAEELHPHQREDVHEKEDKDAQRTKRREGVDQGAEHALHAVPRAHQPHHAEDAEGAEGGKCARVLPLRKVEEGVDSGGEDDDEVNPVEGPREVAFPHHPVRPLCGSEGSNPCVNGGRCTLVDHSIPQKLHVSRLPWRFVPKNQPRLLSSSSRFGSDKRCLSHTVNQT